MKKLTLYHESSGGGFKQWSIWMEKDRKTVTVEWGKVGCTLQTSSDTAKPKGKEGTAAYMDEFACAQFNMDRQIRKKREEGYRETMEDADTQDLFAGLTKRFVPAKPRNDVDDDKLRELDYQGKLWIQRKRDGQRHIVLITKTGKVKIYSRRMDDMTAHFPLLCEVIGSLGFPKKTILDGEILIEDRSGADNFRAVGTITRAKPEKAAQREASLIQSLRYMVFDCLYFAGKPVWEQPYEYRYHEVLCNYLPVADEKLDTTENPVFVPQILNGVGVTMERAKAEGWEGIVCWLWEDTTEVRDGGKPKRTGCIKWKPKREQDFIATGYFLGSGELSNVVGGFTIAEILPDGSGKWRDCGKVGTGLDAQMRKDALKWKYPCVLSVEFDKQEPEGKLRFPVVLKKHEDKTPDECIGRELEGDE
jgi:bifunctional non-homologous end joining protein LigD